MSYLEELRVFCEENGVDDQAREKMEDCEQWEVEAVLAQGGLTGVRNPSAAMISRLKTVHKGDGKGKGGRKGGAKGFENWNEDLQKQVEDFIWEKELDQRASDAIKECTDRVAEALLQKPMDDARNPSAVCLSLLKRIEQDLNGWGGRGNDRGGKGWGRDDGKGKGKGGRYGKNDGGYGGKNDGGYGGKKGGGKRGSPYESYGKGSGSKGYNPY